MTEAAKAWLQWPLILVSVSLQLLLISALIRGPFRHYPFVFVYSLVLFFTTTIDVALLTEVGRVTESELARSFYRSEALRQLLLFTVVVSLIDRALERSLVRHNLRLVLVCGAAAAVLVSSYLHGGEAQYSLRMTKVGRDLSFSSVVLNLLLWTILISKRTKDRELLMVTGGLGLQFTGEAIGQSLRQVAQILDKNQAILLAGNLFLVASHLLRLYVWWETFRKTPTPPMPPSPRREIPTETPART